MLGVTGTGTSAHCRSWAWLPYVAGVLLAVLEAGTQHVLQNDGVLAGDGILLVVGFTGLGIKDWLLHLLQGEGRRESWGGGKAELRGSTGW